MCDVDRHTVVSKNSLPALTEIQKEATLRAGTNIKDSTKFVTQVQMLTQSMICTKAPFPCFLFIYIYFEKLFSSDYREDIR